MSKVSKVQQNIEKIVIFLVFLAITCLSSSLVYSSLGLSGVLSWLGRSFMLGGVSVFFGYLSLRLHFPYWFVKLYHWCPTRLPGVWGDIAQVRKEDQAFAWKMNQWKDIISDTFYL